MKVLTNVRAVLLRRIANNSDKWRSVAHIKGGSTLVNAADIRRYAYSHWVDRSDFATLKGRRRDVIVPHRSSALVLVNKGIVMHAYTWYEQ